MQKYVNLLFWIFIGFFMSCDALANPALFSTPIGFLAGDPSHHSLSITDVVITGASNGTHLISSVPTTIPVLSYMSFYLLSPTKSTGPIIVLCDTAGTGAIYVSYTGKIRSDVVNVKNVPFFIKNGVLQIGSVITRNGHMYCRGRAFFYKAAPYIAISCKD